MNALVAVVGFVTVAALTPGPNNLIVMRTAMHAGIPRALPAIAGVVAGGLALLGLAVAGLAAVIAVNPHIRIAIAIGGACYLAWLGGSLIARSFTRSASATPPGRTAPAGAAGLFLFQFLNPKSWIMMLTAAATVRPGPGGTDPASLVGVFIFIPTICLVLWASCGALLTARLERRGFSRWFDRVMGGLLVGSAILLPLETL